MSDDRRLLSFGVLPVVRPVGWFRCLVPGLILGVALLPMTVRVRQSANVLSRYMTIEAIVERGTLAIERTPMSRLARPADMVRFGAHYYSDKPPVLPVLTSPIYALLVAFDYRFTGSELQFALDNLVLTWVVVGLSSALTLVFFRQLLQVVPIPRLLADILTLGLGFATQLLAYGVTFNNHSVAACLITGAVARTVLEASGHRAGRSRFLAGFLAGMAATIDLPAGGIFLASLGVLQMIRVRSLPVAYLLGSAGPLLLHAGLQSLVTGTPLPVEMYPEAFEFPHSFWTEPEQIWREHGPRWKFGLELLVGPRGWLTVTPALGFGLVGLGLAASRKADPFQPVAWAVLVPVVVLLGYYTWGVRRTDFGGESFGTRHLLPISPVGFWFAVVGLDRLRSKWIVALFVVAMAIGCVYSFVGQDNPWKPIESVRKSDPWLQKVQWLVIYPRSQNLENPGAPK